jgi:hypothetical protein
MDFAQDDILQNFTGKADQAMNGNEPWYGVYEKNQMFVQMFIEASTLSCFHSIAITSEVTNPPSIFFVYLSPLHFKYHHQLSIVNVIINLYLVLYYLYIGTSTHAC